MVQDSTLSIHMRFVLFLSFQVHVLAMICYEESVLLPLEGLCDDLLICLYQFKVYGLN